MMKGRTRVSTWTAGEVRPGGLDGILSRRKAWSWGDPLSSPFQVDAARGRTGTLLAVSRVTGKRNYPRGSSEPSRPACEAFLTLSPAHSRHSATTAFSALPSLLIAFPYRWSPFPLDGGIYQDRA